MSLPRSPLGLSGSAASAASSALPRGPDERRSLSRARASRRALGLSAGEVSSTELTRAYLSRIAAYDQTGPVLNAVLHLRVPHRWKAIGRGKMTGIWIVKGRGHPDRAADIAAQLQSAEAGCNRCR
jgi:hypothetical protein